jgi:hypothetical protein
MRVRARGLVEIFAGAKYLSRSDYNRRYLMLAISGVHLITEWLVSVRPPAGGTMLEIQKIFRKSLALPRVEPYT